jgi:hypothetical protein
MESKIPKIILFVVSLFLDFIIIKNPTNNINKGNTIPKRTIKTALIKTSSLKYY